MFQACVDSGFFYLINHGLDSKLLEEVFAQSKKFFALPLEEKMKVFCDKNHRGWTPFEEETLDPNSQSKGSYLKIFFYVIYASVIHMVYNLFMNWTESTASVK